MSSQVINGKMYDWSDITIDISSLSGVQPTEITYDDEVEKEVLYGKGKSPRGWATGNYKSTFKISVYREDYYKILKYCKKKKIDFYELVIPKIVVNFANGTQPTQSDVLQGITFTKRSFKQSQGEKGNKVDLDGIMYKVIKSNGITG